MITCCFLIVIFAIEWGIICVTCRHHVAHLAFMYVHIWWWSIRLFLLYSLAMLLSWLRNLWTLIAVVLLHRLSPAIFQLVHFLGFLYGLESSWEFKDSFFILCISRQATVEDISREFSFLSSLWIAFKAAFESVCVTTVPFPWFREYSRAFKMVISCFEYWTGVR